MVALTQQEKQLVDQFRSLDPLRRRHVLLEIARADADGWRRFHQQGEAGLIAIAKSKGLDWSQLDEEQRQELIEQIADGEGM